MREPLPPAPVAPYLVALGLGAAVAAAVLLTVRHLRRRRRTLQTAAEAALAASRRLPPPDRLAAQAQLLRGLVRARHGEAEARLSGAAWLAALDRTFATTFFTREAGQVYGEALYRRAPAADVDSLDAALGRFVHRLKPVRRA